MSKLLAVALTALLAIAVLPLALPSAAQEAPATRITFEDDIATAGEDGTAMLVDGTLPGDGPILSARWVGTSASGQQFGQDVPREFLRPSGTQFLTRDGDGVDGRLRLPCIFGNPDNPFCQDHPVAVTGRLEITTDGGTAVTNEVPIDFIDPILLRYDIVAPQQVVVVFSEPVRAINTLGLPQEESPADWEVRDSTVVVTDVRVGTDDCSGVGQRGSGSGCTRILTLSQPLGEDQTPVFDYDQKIPPGLDDPTRSEYEDGARNVARLRSGQGFDRIRPAVPTITQAAGRTPVDGDAFGCGSATDSQVLTADPRPTLQVTNALDSHRVLVTVDGVDVTDPQAVPDGQRPFPVAVPERLADGGHVVEVVALDNPRTSGSFTSPANRSDEARPGPAERADGEDNPICLVVDTTAPKALSAIRDPEDPRAVIVTLDEAVDPTSAGTWTIAPGSAQAATATGVTRTDLPAQRRVTFADPIPGGLTSIRWTGGSGDRYADAAGNPLADVTLPITPPPPALPPIVLEPGPQTPRYTADPDIEVAGRLDPDQTRAQVARVVVDGAGGSRDAQLADDGTWRTTATAPEDGTYRFTAVTETTFGERSTAGVSDVVTYDGTPPTASLQYPPQREQQVLPLPQETPERGPGPFDVEFAVDDPNGLFESATVTAILEGRDDQVQTYRGNPDRGIVTVDVPADYTGTVTVRVVGRDLAGNESDPVDGVVEIVGDLLTPTRAVLSPNQVTGAVVTVTFPAPLSGRTLPTDWSATDGITGGARRSPVEATVQGETVVLRFATPFPTPQADPNASPRLDLRPTLAGPAPLADLATLQGPSGRRVVVDGLRVRDVTPPRSPSVSPQTIGPARLADPAPAGTSCSPEPNPGCPFTATFRGSTDDSLDPNLVRVLRVPTGAPTQGGEVVVPQRRVADDGTFTVTVPVTPNATSTFRVEVDDPNGNDAPEAAVVQVIEDSRGPAITTFLATLEGEDQVLLRFTGDERMDTATLTYRAGAGQQRTIVEDLAVGGTQGSFRWDVPDDVDLATDAVLLGVVATDPLGNVGLPATTGISNLPQITTATVVDELTIEVTTSEPVATEQRDAAGFAVSGGPGVRDTDVAGSTITLDLANALDPDATAVTYNGQGGWAAPDGRPLRAGSVPIRIPADVLLPVTGLAAGPGCTDPVISFVDERNDPALVTGYEVTRDGEVITTLEPGERITTDPDAPDGVRVYGVTPLGEDGLRGETRTVQVRLGRDPVDPAARQRALDAGTGAPTGSVALDQPRFPAAPNLGVDGGVVVSCDGRMAALVPEGAIDGPAYAALVRRSPAPAQGYKAVGDAYQLVVVRAQPGFPAVDALDRYVEMSARGMRGALSQVEVERVAALRPHDDAATRGADELAARVGEESVASHLLTVGTVEVAEAAGATTRAYGPDPAIAADRFATAAALSQTVHDRAATAVLARADDYPDALAAAPLAAQVGGPVLLTRTGDLPATTLLELRRLEAEVVHLVGGTAAISAAVEAQLTGLGLQVVRSAGPTRFETAAEVARRVGTVDGGAFLATGTGFADALTASAPAAAIGRPILLTAPGEIPAPTLQALDAIGALSVHVVGGESAVGATPAEQAAERGLRVRRSGGATRYGTAVELARAMVGDGLLELTHPVMASGDGDGRTSPDALAAGPVGGRQVGPLLLTPKLQLAPEVAEYLRTAPGLRGITLAGGEAAVTETTRAEIDAAAG